MAVTNSIFDVALLRVTFLNMIIARTYSSIFAAFTSLLT